MGHTKPTSKFKEHPLQTQRATHHKILIILILKQDIKNKLLNNLKTHQSCNKQIVCPNLDIPDLILQIKRSSPHYPRCKYSPPLHKYMTTWGTTKLLYHLKYCHGYEKDTQLINPLLISLSLSLSPIQDFAR